MRPFGADPPASTQSLDIGLIFMIELHNLCTRCVTVNGNDDFSRDSLSFFRVSWRDVINSPFGTLRAITNSGGTEQSGMRTSRDARLMR